MRLMSIKLLLSGSVLVDRNRRKWLVSSMATTCGHFKDLRNIDFFQQNLFVCNNKLEFTITKL